MVRSIAAFLLLAAGVAGAEPPAGEAASTGEAEEAPGAGAPGAEPATPGEVLPDDLEAGAPADAGEGELPLQPSQGVEEIVITGTVLEHSLQHEPVSATTFGAEELRTLRIQDISDLANYTANLEVNTARAASNPNLFIRGIGLKDYNANAPGAVAIYQDGVPIDLPAIQLGQIYDVENVAVRRGPQGSVDGRNATAGAIYMTSVLPGEEFTFNGDISYGNYNTVNANGGITVPLIDDWLTSRVAFTANFGDGYTRNRCAGWDPESIDKPVLIEETLRESFGDARDTGRLGNQRLYPVAGLNPSLDPQGRPLTADQVCVWELPGRLDRGLPVPGGGRQFDADPIWDPLDDPVRGLTPEHFAGLKRWVNNMDDWAARGILRFTPPINRTFEGTGEMEWILNLHGQQNRSDSLHLQMLRSEYRLEAGVLKERVEGFSEVKAGIATGFEDPKVIDGFFAAGTEVVPGGRGGSDPYTGWYDADGTEFLDAMGLSLKGTWDLGPVGDAESGVLTWLTGAEWYDKKIESEEDATPRILFPATWQDSGWQVSQELRAEFQGERLRAAVGGFFLAESVDSHNIFPGTLNRRSDQRFTQNVVGGAPYLSGSYQIADELRLELGARYNLESKDFQLESSTVGLQSNQEVVQLLPEEQSRLWTGMTGDATLVYSPEWELLQRVRIDEVDVYAKYARGMKGGHFNAGLTLLGGNDAAQILEPVEPEYIHSVELGWKSRWFDDRLVLNLAGFRYWYTDLQVFDYWNENGTLPIQRLFNADADVLGAELDLNAQPIPGLELRLSAGWLQTEFGNFVVSKAINQPRGQGPAETFNYKGNSLISAPEWSLSTIVEYTFPLYGWGYLVPQYDFSYRSKTWLDPQQLEPISQDPYLLQNLRLAYRTEDERIELAGWVENLTDERYKIDVFDLSIGFNQIIEVWSEPRRYGFTLSYRY